MLGFRFIKSPPTTYLLQYRAGAVAREGAGLSFFYYAPNSSLVAVPIASRDQAFIFEQVTSDFQMVTVQGQVSYRVSDPRKTAAMLDFSLTPDGKNYVSEDPTQLPDRIVRMVAVLSQQTIQSLSIREALLASDRLAASTLQALAAHPEINSLGIEILTLSILGIKPTPETARALEAEAREAILKSADDAIVARRNAAVENERAIRESELDTEIAVELKKRTIRETQMEAETSVRKMKATLRASEMQAEIALEESRKEYVARNAENSRTLADAEAYRVAAVMKSLEAADPRVVQSLAAAGMQPGQLIAQAFGGIAEHAGKIGQFNVSSELLQALIRPPTPLPETRNARTA